MPLYEYRCPACGHTFERLGRFSDPATHPCRECGTPANRLLGVPALQFKGSGWYVTDYGKGNGGSSKPGGGNGGTKNGGSTSSTSGGGSSPDSSGGGSSSDPSGGGSSSDSSGGASSTGSSGSSSGSKASSSTEAA